MNEHLNIEFNTTDNIGETIPESIRTERVFQGGIDSSANRSSIGSKKKINVKMRKVSLSRGDPVLHPALSGKPGLDPQLHPPAAVRPGSSSSPSLTSSEPLLRRQQ